MATKTEPVALIFAALAAAATPARADALITFDCSRLTLGECGVFTPTGEFIIHGSGTIPLADGSYGVSPAGGIMSHGIWVIGGRITDVYCGPTHAAPGSFYTLGNDGTSITYTGFPTTWNTTALSQKSFGIFGLTREVTCASQRQVLTLLPTCGSGYTVSMGASLEWSCPISVDFNGDVGYPSSCASSLSGAGTPSLDAIGLPFTIDTQTLAMCGSGVPEFILNLFDRGAGLCPETLVAGDIAYSTGTTLDLVAVPFYGAGFEPIGPSAPPGFGFSLLGDGSLRFLGAPPPYAAIAGNRLIVLDNPGAGGQTTIDALQAYVARLPASAYRNGDTQLGNAYNNKLDAIKSQVAHGACAGALDKIEHDLLPKSDGCGQHRAADADDFFINCAVQAQIVCDLSQIAATIEATCVPRQDD